MKKLCIAAPHSNPGLQHLLTHSASASTDDPSRRAWRAARPNPDRTCVPRNPRFCSSAERDLELCLRPAALAQSSRPSHRLRMLETEPNIAPPRSSRFCDPSTPRSLATVFSHCDPSDMQAAGNSWSLWPSCPFPDRSLRERLALHSTDTLHALRAASPLGRCCPVPI